MEVSIFYSEIPSVHSVYHKMEFWGFFPMERRYSAKSGDFRLNKFLKMEDRGSNRKGKRTRQDDEEDYNLTLASTLEETPDFTRVLLVAQDVCPFLKLTKRNITREELQLRNWNSLLPKIFSEDLLPTRLRSSNPGTSAGGSVVVPPSTSSPLRILGSGRHKLQLCVNTKMPTRLFAEDNVKGDGGSDIHVSLIDLSNGSVVQTGPASAANLDVVVLKGDFNKEISDGWEHDFFIDHLVKEREGKRPLLVGTVRVKLNGGEGTLGDLSFTDNSSWIPSQQFRLGFALSSGFFEGIRVMEGKTNAFRVLHHRGKAYAKCFPPALHNEVWRLINIAKDGPLHKSLDTAEIRSVEDLLRLHAKDPQRLRTILGKGMTDKMWETTIKHAMTFSPLGDKFYVYYTDWTNSSGVIFNHIHQPLGFITDGQFAPLQSLEQTHKFLQKSRVKKAYENWDQVVECDEQFHSSIITSNEMQDCPAEQAYSINHNITPTQTGHTFQSVQQIQPDYTSVPQQSLEPPLSRSDPVKWPLQNDLSWADKILENDIDDRNGHNMAWGASFSDSCDDYFDRLFNVETPPGYRKVKAVVGWLKIKAVLKWGMMVSISAKKRAKLTELD